MVRSCLSFNGPFVPKDSELNERKFNGIAQAQERVLVGNRPSCSTIVGEYLSGGMFAVFEFVGTYVGGRLLKRRHKRLRPIPRPELSAGVRLGPAR